MKTNINITEYRIIDTQGRPGLWSSEKRMAAKLIGHIHELPGYLIERRENLANHVRFALSELDLLALSYNQKISPL